MQRRDEERNPADPNSPENVEAKKRLQEWIAKHSKSEAPQVTITPHMRKDAERRANRDRNLLGDDY